MTTRDSISAVTSSFRVSGTEPVFDAPAWRDLALRGGRVTKYKGTACGIAPHCTVVASAGLFLAAASVFSLGGMLLSSTAAFAGDCGPGPNVVCLGPAAPGTDVTQSIISPGGDLTITTAPGFGLDVGSGGYGVVIEAGGTGDLKFVDEYNSSIHADGRALDINAPGLTGAVDVKSSGELVSDGIYGLYLSAGTGVTSSKLHLNRVESAHYVGMWVENAGGALSITSSDAIVGGSASGAHNGLRIDNAGTATGGILVDVVDVSGSASGISISQAGQGTVTVRSSGKIEGGSSGAGIEVVTQPGSTGGVDIDVVDVSMGWGGHGIDVVHQGAGDTKISASGLVEGGISGISVSNTANGGSTTILVNDVNGIGDRGIHVENYSDGKVQISSTGTVNGGYQEGIRVDSSGGGDVEIDANDVDAHSGGGVAVYQTGGGAIDIAVTGTVTNDDEFSNGDGVYVSADDNSTGLKVNANNIVANDEGMELHYSGTGVVDIDSAGLIEAGAHGIYAIIGANAEGLDIDVNSIKSGDDGIYGGHGVGGTVNITVRDSIVSGDDAIELYLDNGDVGQVNVNVHNAKGADFGIYIVDRSDAVDPNDPNAVNNDLNITTTGKIEAGSGWGIWAQTDAGVLSNITVKSTSIIDSASGQAIFNDYGDSHVIIENAREIVDDPDTPEVEMASVNGVVTLGWGADQLDLHGGFSGITELNGGYGDTDRDVLNLFDANSTYNANKITGWDVFNIKNSYLTLDGPLGNLIVGTAGVAGTGIFLTDGSTLDSRQPGLNIYGNLTLDAGTTFLSDRNDDAGNPGRGDTYITGFLTNGGTVSIVDGAANDDVAVHGLYTGNNGTVILDTVLGDDTSATDTMTFSGGTAGHTNVIVRNVGGAGAQTVEGIKIINVSGASDGTFALTGDYEIAGQRAVIAGAYGYTLWKNGVSTPADGDWYLRSQLVPVDPSGPLYQPGAPAFEAYPQILLSLNGLPTLQQRTGNRLWSGNGAGVVSQGTDAVDEQAPVGASPVIEGSGIWGRIEGAYADIDPNVSTTGSQYDFNTQKFQAGLDIPVLENGSGALVGGVTAHYGHASADMSSVFGHGSISTDGYGVGATLTWYDSSGFYLDAQGQVSWYDSDLESDTLGELTSGNNGSGYALSLEAGKRIELNDLTLTPQAQLVYSSVDFDSFTQVIGDRDTADVSLREGDSLRGRFGLSLDREASWQADNGLLSRSHVYSIANLHYEFLDGTVVDVSGAELANRADRLWGGIGLGGSYNWNDDKYSLHGEGSVNTSLENFADSYDLKGTAGLRVSW